MAARSSWPPAATILRAGTLAVAALYLAVFAFMAVRRVPYSFELEWMEGGSLEQVRRILAGQPLYTRPTVEYVSYRYAPLYFYVSAAVAAVVGQEFLALRLVSFLASAGSLVLIFFMVRRETGSRESGLLAAGLFAATARVSGFWFDVARVDSLYLFLLLLAAFCIRSGGSPVAAGAALALAFHTKQTAALPALGWVLYALWKRRPQAPTLLGTFAVGSIGGALLCDAASGGWYTPFVFRPHWMLWHRLAPFWSRDFLGAVPLAALAAIFFLARPSTRDRAGREFYLVFALIMVGTAWYSRLIVGAHVNALLPAFAAMAVLFGLGLHEARRELAARPEGDGGLEATVWAAAALQFVILGFNPLTRMPTAADAAAGARLVQTIAAVGGDVLVPNHPYLVVRAGGHSHAHSMALGEVFLFSKDTSFGQELKRRWRQALCDRRFAAVLTDRDMSFLPELDAAYREQRPLHETRNGLFPIPGGGTALYVPRSELVFLAGTAACRP